MTRGVGDDVPALDAGQPVADPSEQLAERGVEDHGLGVGVVEQVDDLVRPVAEVRVDRHHRRLERGDDDFEVLDAVVQVAGDLRLVAEPSRQQVGSERVGVSVDSRHVTVRSPCTRHGRSGTAAAMASKTSAKFQSVTGRRQLRRHAAACLRHAHHALRSAALACADARRAELRRPCQRPRRGDGRLAGSVRRPDRGTHPLQPVRPARHDAVGRGVVRARLPQLPLPDDGRRGRARAGDDDDGERHRGDPRSPQGRRHAGARRHGVARSRSRRVRARGTPRTSGRGRRAVHRRSAGGRHAHAGGRRPRRSRTTNRTARCTRSRSPRRSPR